MTEASINLRKAMSQRVKLEAEALLVTIEALPGMFPDADYALRQARQSLEKCVLWCERGINSNS